MKLGAEPKELVLDLLSDRVVNAVGLIPSSVEGVELWLGAMDEAGRRGALQYGHQVAMIPQRGLWEVANQS